MHAVKSMKTLIKIFFRTAIEVGGIVFWLAAACEFINWMIHPTTR
jgi:hypothetical protein